MFENLAFSHCCFFNCMFQCFAKGHEDGCHKSDHRYKVIVSFLSSVVVNCKCYVLQLLLISVSKKSVIFCNRPSSICGLKVMA